MRRGEYMRRGPIGGPSAGAMPASAVTSPAVSPTPLTGALEPSRPDTRQSQLGTGKADSEPSGTGGADGSYEFSLPTHFQLPQGVELKFDPGNPRAQMAVATAKELGLTQQPFSRLLQLDAEIGLQGEKTRADSIAGEMKKLGPSFSQRQPTLTRQLLDRLGNDKLAALYPHIVTADAFEALEALLGIAIPRRQASTVPGWPAGYSLKAVNDSAHRVAEYAADAAAFTNQTAPGGTC
jgi:hypothetical protein